MRLQPYHFTVTYRPGKYNAADALSRLPLKHVPKKNVGEEFICYIARSAAPKALSVTEIEKVSGEDSELKNVRTAVRTGVWPKEVSKYVHVKDEIACVGKLLLRGHRIIVPESLRKHVMALAHEGHQGIVKCKGRLREKVWWPGIDKDVEKYIKACQPCQMVGKENPPEPLKPTQLPKGPWQHVGLDLCGPFPTGEHLLVGVDYFSRWFEVAVLRQITAQKIISHLDEWCATHGLPEMVITDNGSQFRSEEFREFCQQNDIEHRKVTPYYPQANGEVERQNKTLLKAIRTMSAEGKDWKKEIGVFLKAYRSTPHCVTGVSPAELMFGRKLRVKIPSVCLEKSKTKKEVEDRHKQQKLKGKQYFDTRKQAKEMDLNPGDLVLLRQQRENKLSTNFGGIPHKVIEKKGNSIQVESPEGVEKRRNVEQVKKMIFEEKCGKQKYWRENVDLEQQEGEDLEIELENSEQAVSVDIPKVDRPRRERRAPSYLKDYYT